MAGEGSLWHQHNKHFFILTSAGKPIYTRHAYSYDSSATGRRSSSAESNMADITAMASLLSAIIGRTLTNSSDPIQYIVSGGTTFVFLLRGQLYLVCVSKTGETIFALQQQLRALYNILLSFLTSKIDDRLSERPGLDLRSSLTAANSLWTNTIRIANRSPTFTLDAIPIMPLSPPSTRNKALSAIVSACSGLPGVVYVLLMAGYSLVCWATHRNKDYALKPGDAALLTILSQTSSSVRIAPAFLPICLPGFNDAGYLHAFVTCLQEVEPIRKPTFTLAKAPAFSAPVKAVSEPIPIPTTKDEVDTPAYAGMGSDVADDAVVAHGVSLTEEITIADMGKGSSSAAADDSAEPDDDYTPAAHGGSGGVNSDDDDSPASPDPLADLSSLALADKSMSADNKQTIDAGAVAAAESGGDADVGARVHRQHPETARMGLILALVSTESDAAHLNALTQRRNEIVDKLRTSNALRDITETMAHMSVIGQGSYSAAGFGIPGLLHFVYMWKPLRQYSMCAFPALISTHIQQKALLRAYQHVFDRLVSTIPQLRYSFSSYQSYDIAHIAGIHTTNAVLLCAFDADQPEEKLGPTLEKLAKQLKKEHDKLLLPYPGTL